VGPGAPANKSRHRISPPHPTPSFIISTSMSMSFQHHRCRLLHHHSDTDSRLPPMSSFCVVSVIDSKSAPCSESTTHSQSTTSTNKSFQGSGERRLTGWCCQYGVESTEEWGGSASGLSRASAWCGRTCGTVLGVLVMDILCEREKDEQALWWFAVAPILSWRSRADSGKLVLCGWTLRSLSGSRDIL